MTPELFGIIWLSWLSCSVFFIILAIPFDIIYPWAMILRDSTLTSILFFLILGPFGLFIIINQVIKAVNNIKINEAAMRNIAQDFD